MFDREPTYAEKQAFVQLLKQRWREETVRGRVRPLQKAKSCERTDRVQLVKHKGQTTEFRSVTPLVTSKSVDALEPQKEETKTYFAFDSFN